MIEVPPVSSIQFKFTHALLRNGTVDAIKEDSNGGIMRHAVRIDVTNQSACSASLTLVGKERSGTKISLTVEMEEDAPYLSITVPGFAGREQVIGRFPFPWSDK